MRLVPGESAARFLLQCDVVRMIWTIDPGSRSGRMRWRIVDTEIIARSPDAGTSADGRVLRGTWVERWHLDRSGEVVPYDVTFTADGGGGTFFQVGEAVPPPPAEVAAHRNDLGTDLARQGLREQAIAEFRAAIRIRPDDAVAHSNLGLALREQGKPEEAIAAYREAIRIQPDLAAAHNGLGGALQGLGNPEEAIAAYREAIRIQPYFAPAHNNLGNALRAQGKLDEAVAAYRESIRIQPNAVPHYNLGIALKAQEKPEEAVAEFRTAIRLEPAYPEAHYHLARLLVLVPDRPRSDYEKGLVHAQKAIESAPKDGYGYGTLALAEYRLGHWDASLAAGEKALAMPNGGDALNLLTLALAHWQKNEKGRARDWFDKAVAFTNQHAPDDPELHRFMSEVTALLGQPGLDADDAGSRTAVAADGPK